jgi:hypothetical protein
LRSSKVAQKTTPLYISQDPEILKLTRDPSYKNKIKGLLYTGCFSTSPIKPSFELKRNDTAMLNKIYFKNIKFLKILNLSSPP